jgi:hypothetical protein
MAEWRVQESEREDYEGAAEGVAGGLGGRSSYDNKKTGPKACPLMGKDHAANSIALVGRTIK